MHDPKSATAASRCCCTSPLCSIPLKAGVKSCEWTVLRPPKSAFRIGSESTVATLARSAATGERLPYFVCFLPALPFAAGTAGGVFAFLSLVLLLQHCILGNRVAVGVGNRGR